MVPEVSATFTGVLSKSYQLQPLEGDHRSMIKFESRMSSGYQRIKGRIHEIANVAGKHQNQQGVWSQPQNDV